MKFGLLLIMLTFASEQNENKFEGANLEERFEQKNAEDLILVKIEEDEYAKVQKQASKYIGVVYDQSKWKVVRWSKNGMKNIYNGYHGDEETAAHASDTLARKLMANGEQKHKLNFPDDDTEVWSERHYEQTSSIYIGVSKRGKSFYVSRKNKNDSKTVYNGGYKDEKTAAHASDTLARKLMVDGEQKHKLNFPDDDTEVFSEKVTTRNKISSNFIGVTYMNRDSIWSAYRWSKIERKNVYNGSYDNEEKAAHASDTLARKLMKDGEQNHKLNFPYDDTQVHPETQRNKRNRSDNGDTLKNK